ncbi:aconitate hydratase [Gordonia sp. (in: high G+C Gram-positive bacteria)]|uniref:aconitate hydratase n=1 Tax=Gordonia sp. (in: high G+C Gram-positive bacteria) TaxID=84139 RepID=UPI00169CE183|nr:aconitate hydratase [Gordonia sp. (in: high G+C Gram-positive bacteria)]NLG46395.1 aconitate hydratase [Gordonia sp. (in: high G+C Gram-positive bacteria)]
MTTNSFASRDQLDVGGTRYEVHRIDRIVGSARLPYSLKVLLENLLRNEDGTVVTAAQVEAVRDWDPTSEQNPEIQYTPARVLMQDFTGVPCVVDLVAMRDAMTELGGPPAKINPQIPAELVIDHSVIAEAFASAEAFGINSQLEFERNKERYQLLRWGQQAFDDFLVVPPDTGICHQVNLEYLSRVTFTRERDGVTQAYPDTLVGTDSHTPMVNGLGVLGWGVGGIEAEAAMLGQPISMLIPQVIGVRLNGELTDGTTATDLVLTVAELLRSIGVVGKFVEFFGPSVQHVPLATRATIGNMSPEYGSTATMFPIDDVTLDYLRLTGRADQQIALVEAYAKLQGLWHDPDHVPDFSRIVDLDLSTVEASIAGPSRPQDRIPLGDAPRTVLGLFGDQVGSRTPGGVDSASAASFPASDPIAPGSLAGHDAPPRHITADQLTANEKLGWPSDPVEVSIDGRDAIIDHGDVVIAAITSCTNTSNPAVMLAAALLAKNAVEKGLRTRPWVKTTLAPGSRAVTDYFDRSGLTPYLDQLGFHLVGYGCTTCIGNSGPLIPEVSGAIGENDLNVSAVLSGNRNFEGRIHPEVRMNFLASPPLVIAYALAGSMHTDLLTEPLNANDDGDPVYLRDIWPSEEDIQKAVDENVEAGMFTKGYSDVYAGDGNWRSMSIPDGDVYDWDETSTYIQRPPFFDGMTREPQPITDISGARVLAKLGDSVTTDHISPAGAIKLDGPAGRYLTENGIERADFNSYGSRRGNHHVMIRGTFANVRLRNQLVPGVEGGVTKHWPDGEQMTIYDASVAYQKDAVPLVVLAGKDYGSGSSRDWAAKGTRLLGVRAVIAESYERIHRSNLIGMGVLPLQFQDGDSAESLDLIGDEVYSVSGIADGDGVADEVTVTVESGGQTREFGAKVRIDTPAEAAYYLNDGILQYVLRNLLAKA